MKKPTGTRLGDIFRLTVDGKIVRDERAMDAKLDVSTRLKKRKSKRVTVKKRVEQDYRP